MTQQNGFKVTSYKAHQLQSLRNVKMHSPCLIQIQSGTKRLYWSQDVTSLSSSTYLLCCAGASLSFENAPASGYFQSNVFSFYLAPNEKMLALSRKQKTSSAPAIVARDKNVDVTLNTLSQYDLSKLSFASQSLLVNVFYQQLAELGALHHLFPAQALSFSSKVANYLADSPEQPNSIEDICAVFGLSKATFIRHLAKEHIRYRDLLVEVRLNNALALMQSGVHEPQILAHRCGYASVTRFNQRFKEKFGIDLKGYINSVTVKLGKVTNLHAKHLSPEI